MFHSSSFTGDGRAEKLKLNFAQVSARVHEKLSRSTRHSDAFKLTSLTIRRGIKSLGRKTMFPRGEIPRV